jgi:ubiquitin-like protein ATG12
MEGRDSPDLPLTMSASTVLMTLPHDATAALAAAGNFPTDKVVLRFKPIGSARSPPPKREQVRVTSSQKFESVVTYLRKILGVKEHESLFLYVNSVFAPSLDEVVGNLWRVSRGRIALIYGLV